MEAFPWSALADPTTVPELLRRVAAPNVGQLIDVSLRESVPRTQRQPSIEHLLAPDDASLADGTGTLPRSARHALSEYDQSRSALTS